MDTETRAYWRWRFDERPPDRTTFGQVEEDAAAFRKSMRQAYQAIRRGEDPSQHITNALGIPEKDDASIRRALLARRLLPRVKDEDIQLLRKRIGEDAFERLPARAEAVPQASSPPPLAL